jgi:hypothetical protein
MRREEVMLTGGCYCGNVRYEAHGVPFNPNICHCADCRRVSGAPFVAWFSVEPSQLQFVNGEPRYFASSEKVQRSFCPDCGTPLTYWNKDSPDELDVSTCSLDTPESVPPLSHIWTTGKLPWIHINDDLPIRPE